MSTKTIAIVGITGTQGSSVAEAFLNTPGYKIRGITRDTTKDSAKAWTSKGVEMVAADLDDPSSLKTAFAGAQVIFGVTDFWQHMFNPATAEVAQKRGLTPNDIAYEREIEQGKNIVDAAFSTLDTLERFVLSTEVDAKKWSKGKITFNLHFDSKAATWDYLKEKYPELAKKTSYLLLGFYADNWKQAAGPRKQEDGTYKVYLPMSGGAKVPIVDARADTGNLTKALVDAPAGTALVGAGSYISFDEWCEIWSRVNGKTCTFEQQDRSVIEQMLGTAGKELADMFAFIDEFGYDGRDPDLVYPWDLGVPVKYTTVEEYIKKQDWSPVL